MIDPVRDKTANPSGPRRPPAGRMPAMPAGGPLEVAVVVFDGVTLFELGVACDVFGASSPGGAGYRLSVCSAGSASVTLEAGLRLAVPCGLERLRRADTVVVPPTDALERVPVAALDALTDAHRRGCRIVSLCTGAFVLAEAGLLDGRRATTHWTECEELASRYPGVSVDPGVLYVDEGDILTSAGSAASIDLCLHVVRCDYGSEAATRIARQLVVPPQRDGGQAQFIETPVPGTETSTLFADCMEWVQEHLDEALTVGELAARSAMSPRTFARRFVATTGTTPHQWLQRQRVTLAQRLLETSDVPVDVVARRSGFRTAGNLRKYFGRALHTSPQAYRRAFRGAPGDQAPSTAADRTDQSKKSATTAPSRGVPKMS